MLIEYSSIFIPTLQIVFTFIEACSLCLDGVDFGTTFDDVGGHSSST